MNDISHKNLKLVVFTNEATPTNILVTTLKIQSVASIVIAKSSLYGHNPIHSSHNNKNSFPSFITQTSQNTQFFCHNSNISSWSECCHHRLALKYPRDIHHLPTCP